MPRHIALFLKRFVVALVVSALVSGTLLVMFSPKPPQFGQAAGEGAGESVKVRVEQVQGCWLWTIGERVFVDCRKAKEV